MALRTALSSHSSRRSGPSGGGVPMWKIALPVAVIVACVGWIAYLIWGGESTRVEVTPAGASVFEITNAIGDREDLLERVSIRVQGEPPDEFVLVEGAVKTKALLDELNAKVAAAAKAPVRVQVNVVVKP